MRLSRAVVSGLLSVLLLLGATATMAQDQDPSEAGPQQSDARPVPRDGALAGTYASTVLGPAMTFSVDDGWAVAYPPVDGLGFAIAPRGGGHILGFVPFAGTVMADPCFKPERSMDLSEAQGAEGAWLTDPANRLTLDPTIEGFWNHLASNPYLTVSEPVDVRVGGFSGLQADISAAVSEECFPRHTVLWHEPTAGLRGAWIMNDGSEARYTAVDVAGTVVVIAAESAPGLADHEARLELDDAVLETLTFVPIEPLSEG